MVAELLGLLERARVAYSTWKQRYQAAGGAAGTQAGILAFEQQATRIAEFQPGFVPGLLQTAEYARELLRLPAGPGAFGASEADIDRMVGLRLQRQQVLYTPGRQVQVVLLEAALRARVCSPPTLAGQLDRLLAVAGLPTLDLGVIPFEADLPAFPLHEFAIFDDELVLIETLTGEQQLSDPDEVAYYVRCFDLLRGAARHGRAAVAVIQRVLADLRSDSTRA